jgi:YD repeat-containing protein
MPTGFVLKSVTYTNLPDFISAKLKYQYDSWGRLLYVMPEGSNQSPVNMPVEYDGNRIVPRPRDGNLNVTRVVTFVLRPDGKPAQRIVEERFREQTAGQTLDNFDADTTWFNYDAKGTLVSTRLSRRDSGYVLTGDTFLQVQKWNGLTEYMMSNGDVTLVKVQADYTGRSWLNGQEQRPERASQRVTLDVQYNEQRPYPDFGINDFLMREGWTNGISPWMRWVKSPHYPSYTKVTDEYLDPNGNVLRRDVAEIKNYDLSFTPEGKISRFVKRFNQGGQLAVDFEYGQ